MKHRPNPLIEWDFRAAAKLFDLLHELADELWEAYEDQFAEQAVAELNAPQPDPNDDPPYPSDDEPPY